MTDKETELQLETLRREVESYAAEHGLGAGLNPTLIDGLQCSVRPEPMLEPNCFYHLSVAVILQGEKRVTAAGEVFEYGAGFSIITASDIPTSFELLNCTNSKPFISTSLQLDSLMIGEILQELPAEYLSEENAETQGGQVFTVAPATVDLIDSFIRLYRLMKHPEQLALRAPLVKRDLYCALLMSPEGAGLRKFCARNSLTNRIAKTISWIRNHPTETLNVDTLSEMAVMSRTTFFRHFKTITGMSPLQYQKRLCLYLAQNLMLSKGMSAAEAAYQVGYTSTTQFSREYKKVFGLPPRKSLIEQVSRIEAAKN